MPIPVISTPITDTKVKINEIWYRWLFEIATGLSQSSSSSDTSSVTLTVGSGGDYATLGEALLAASRLRLAYVNAGAEGVDGISVTISILTGYTETTGVSLNQIDMGNVTIIAADNPVPATVTGDLFTFNYAISPIIHCTFDMGSTGGHGIWAATSRVSVSLGGVINAGKSGLYSIAENWLAILDSDFNSAQEYGAYVNHSSHGQIGGCDFSSAGLKGGNSVELGLPYDGINVRHSSHVNLSDSDFTGAPGFSIAVSCGGICDLAGTFFDTLNVASNAIHNDGIIFEN